MLIWFTESKSNNSVAVSPKHVVSVIEIVEGEYEGKTYLVLETGGLVINESTLDAVGKINGALA